MSHPLQTGSFHWMKSINKSTILNVIRLHGPISRAEIAKKTKLTPPTVTNIVGELLESRLVVESELGESSGGRKPILLRINSGAFYLVGVYAGAKKLRAVCATLDGQIVCENERVLPHQPNQATFLHSLKEIIQHVIDESKANRQQFLGIGVGMHGLVDPVRGISIFAPNLPLRHVPIKEELEQEFSLPVEVENDVRALAIGESWFGQGQGVSHFVCVNVGTGIGTGMILDYRLYQGATFTAGELGHTTIDMNGPKCGCGNYGCLEALASAPAMVNRAYRLLEAEKPSRLREWIPTGEESLTKEHIHRAAQAGDPLAIQLLEETGRYLGVGMANLINTFNPASIIVSGGVFRAGEFVMKSLRRTVEERALQEPARAVRIVTSQLGPNGTAIGAFTLILNKIFTPEGIQ